MILVTGHELEVIPGVSEGGGGDGLIGQPLIGAFLVNGAKSFFTAAIPEYWLFFLGLLFVLVTLLLPRGVIGLFDTLAAFRKEHAR